MLLYKLETLKDYLTYLKKHPSEANILYSDLLINVTSFFRDPQTMEHLRKEILPRVIKDKNASEPVRIWVAGCSTGQEAYSLAMLIIEVLGDKAAFVPIQIFATDLSEMAVAKARLGQYTKSEVIDISHQRLARFFTKTDDHYRINKLVRDLCVFAPHNLLSDPPFSRMDLISCRNLLIYLDDELQKKVFSTFHYALNPNGFLLLAKSESVGSSPMYFTQIEKAYKVFARKNNTQVRIPLDMPIKPTSMPQENRVTNVKSTDVVSSVDLDKLVDNLLLSKYVPASVVIDQDLEIIQFRGSTNKFLQHPPGRASLNLTKMAHPSLVFELRNIVHKARKSAQPAKKTGLEINPGGKTTYVNIEAVPITNPINQQLFLVLFEEVSEEQLSTAGDTSQMGKRNQQLEAELVALRQDMHSIIEEQEASNEELQSANEEIVSSNEELQSINEELETSREEIQPANEELQTINQELQVRNDQLTESYEYSEAILSTINEATLILDEQLRVRSANKAFYKIFETAAERTEGLTIYELGNRQLDFTEFRDIMHEVVSRNTSVKGLEAIIRVSASRQCNMIIHAKKVVQQRKQTVLLVFEDVTAHRREQALLQQRQKWFEELVDNAPALIWVCDPLGDINFLNQAWIDFTGQSSDNKEETFYNAIHPMDVKAYKSSFLWYTQQQRSFSVEYRLKRNDGEYRWVLENAKPQFSSENIFTGYTGSSMDIHLQKTLTEQLNRHVDERTAELKRANEDLKQTAHRLQSVLNGVPASVTLMEPVSDADGNVIDFATSVYNNKTLELTGQTEEQILKTNLLEGNPELKENGLFDLYVQVLQNVKPAYKEMSDLTGKDQTLAFLITPQVERSGIVVTTLDISNRKQAEIKLKLAAENLQAVLDSSPASIAFFKATDDDASDFRLAVCNKKFSRAFDQLPADLVGTLVSDLFAAERILEMREVYLTSKLHYYERFREEEDKWTAISVSRHDHGVAITEMDVTLLKNAQRQQDEMLVQLNGSYEMIESLSVMKEYVQHRGSFLRTTFHDLRGSFGVIIGAATLLNMMDGEEDRIKVLDMIQRNLTQVAQMMNQLLDYSRLESGEEKLLVEHFDAAAILHELCQVSTQISREKKLSLVFEGDESLPVEGDPVKVRRIAQNIILNAIKYTSNGGVTVKWRTTDIEPDYWEFVVSDTGPGIPKGLISKLDGTAQHVDSEEHSHLSNTDGHGEGIGLFIVKRLCELLRARFELNSSGSGTTFRITMPKKYNS